MSASSRVSRDLALTIIKASAENPEAFDWSLQGFGMLRLYLSRAIRLHVWAPAFAVKDVTTIHTHPWHFRSTVLLGAMTDRLYEEIAAKPVTHRRVRIVCGPGGGAVNEEPEPMSLRLLQEVTLRGGQSYGLTANAIHESIPEPWTVTVIEREFLEDTEHACVFVKADRGWVSAEPRKATPEEVKGICGATYARWRPL